LIDKTNGLFSCLFLSIKIQGHSLLCYKKLAIILSFSENETFLALFSEKLEVFAF